MAFQLKDIVNFLLLLSPTFFSGKNDSAIVSPSSTAAGAGQAIVPAKMPYLELQFLLNIPSNLTHASNESVPVALDFYTLQDIDIMSISLGCAGGGGGYFNSTPVVCGADIGLKDLQKPDEASATEAMRMYVRPDPTKYHQFLTGSVYIAVSACMAAYVLSPIVGLGLPHTPETFVGLGLAVFVLGFIFSF